jgi:glutamate-5-semialdehyde dehydrogenase
MIMKQIFTNNDEKANLELIAKICKRAKNSSFELATASTETKNNVLEIAAKLIESNKDKILSANLEDIKSAEEKQLSNSMIDRLKLNDQRIKAMSSAILEISKLSDPVGKTIWENTRPNGLKIKRITVPLGLLAVIYESRPNVTADAFSLCLKSGNAVILKPGSESFKTSTVIFEILQQSLEEAGLSKDIIAIVLSKSREMVDQLLKMDKYIDVVVPRGGKNLIKKVSEASKIPVFKHLDGNCHTYIHKSSNIEIAKRVLYNAKLRRTGICGATESVLIDSEILNKCPEIFADLNKQNCEIRADKKICEHLDYAVAAQEIDYSTEYLDNIISVKTVDNTKEAINHINKHGSSHTDCIIASDDKACEEFLNSVDSAIVMVNSSTQFADGGEFGLGAEIGIATGKLHARGPVGLEQLVTYKYHVIGNGQIRD